MELQLGKSAPVSGKSMASDFCMLQPSDRAAMVLFEKVLLCGLVNQDEVPRCVCIAL